VTQETDFYLPKKALQELYQHCNRILWINVLSIPNFRSISTETGCKSYPLITLQIQVINLCLHVRDNNQEKIYSTLNWELCNKMRT
jgi:hypothetical protein